LTAKPPAPASRAKTSLAMNGNSRSDIAIGARVKVVRKEDQRSGALTEGVVRDILTRSPRHPHGIKVRLEGGIIGRVKEILGD
jgi:uncharacterized repeat protein (TIGR03833 family)